MKTHTMSVNELLSDSHVPEKVVVQIYLSSKEYKTWDILGDYEVEELIEAEHSGTFSYDASVPVRSF